MSGEFTITDEVLRLRTIVDELREARGALQAGLGQTLDTDDQIIAEHSRDALRRIQYAIKIAEGHGWYMPADPVPQ